MSDWNPKANDLFVRAAEIDAPDKRRLFLEHRCGGDADLQAQVESLLAAENKIGSFLEQAAAPALAAQGATSAYAPITERPGAVIGPYKLMEQIGEGGFGLVFVAEQQLPVRRKVALKVIKPGMDTKEVIARFEAERQALALMDHPNIARVLEAGATDSGRPYFVMELVKGVPITDYCDQNQLTPEERLELFVSVAQAVQHAHTKGVIHRDLKPSNILIAPHDGKPVVKVIDFGVAKAVGQPLTDKTIYTRLTQMIGTPLYMSPEQAEINALDVDTRSDVYALGVLLYELLTGSTPFDRQRFGAAAFDEIRRIILEEEPPKPSTRLSTLGDAMATVSAQRKMEPRKLSALVRGELDWIVMKCLDKDRTRRYETANGLARDVERYLKDEPVEACPPTAGYKLRKFARKHQKALVTAAAFATLLLLGVAGSTWQAVRATQAEGMAQVNERQATANAAQAQEKEQEAKQQRDEAQQRRNEVEALNEKLRSTQAQLRRTLYVAQINLARNAWETGGVERVQELLEQHRPRPGENDLRGFEWNYLHRLCHSDLLTLKHTKGLRSVTYSPDGKRLATVTNNRWGEEAEVKVWDAQTGKELLCFSGGSGSIAFSPDGKRLANLSGQGQVKVMKVRDTETGKELLVFPLPKEFPPGIGSIAYSPDGKRLATGGGQVLKVWDAKTGQELLSFQVKGVGNSLIFSPDGKRLTSTFIDSKANTVKVWDAESGNELLTLQGHSGPVSSVAYSPDGKRLASTCPWDNGVKVWDAESGKEVLTLQGRTAGVNSVAYSQDGKRLAGACSDRMVKVWDAQVGNELFTLKGHVARVFGVSFSPDGKCLASASEDRTAKVWDAQGVENPTTLKWGGPVSSVAISPDGKLLAAAGLVAIFPRDRRALRGEVKVWDLKTGQELHCFKGGGLAVHVGIPDGLASVAFSPDGKQLARAGSIWEPGKGLVGEVKVWNAQTGEELRALKGGGASVAFSPDGKLLASTGMVFEEEQPRGSEVKVWDAQTGKELLALNGGRLFPAMIRDNNSLSVAFSPDGKLLASACVKEISLWDAQTGKELLSLKSGAVSVSYSPDGKRLATSGDGVKVWDAQTGEALLTLKGHTDDWVGRVVYSPDGKRLVTVSRDKSVKVWDAQTGLELLTLEGHGGLLNGVAFSPDGHRLAAGAADGTVKIWDATPLPQKR